ncbi:unnamed protein product, partial [Acidithrix sp. C25]
VHELTGYEQPSEISASMEFLFLENLLKANTRLGTPYPT